MWFGKGYTPIKTISLYITVIRCPGHEYCSKYSTGFSNIITEGVIKSLICANLDCVYILEQNINEAVLQFGKAGLKLCVMMRSSYYGGVRSIWNIMDIGILPLLSLL